jgi:hypothetical protein
LTSRAPAASTQSKPYAGRDSSPFSTMEELERALDDFRAKFALYSMKVDRRYRTLGDMDYDMVNAAWCKYLRLRKQYKGF